MGFALHPVKRFQTGPMSFESDQTTFKKYLVASDCSQVQPATNSVVCSPFPLGWAEEGEWSLQGKLSYHLSHGQE